MPPRLFWHRKARADFISQLQWLETNAGPDTADNFENAVYSLLEKRLAFPFLGVARTRKSGATIRLWVVKGFSEYTILYNRTSSGVTVIRLLHAKQDYTRFLKP